VKKMGWFINYVNQMIKKSNPESQIYARFSLKVNNKFVELFSNDTILIIAVSLQLTLTAIKLSQSVQSHPENNMTNVKRHLTSHSM
jgi:hypothetical protein